MADATEIRKELDEYLEGLAVPAVKSDRGQHMLSSEELDDLTLADAYREAQLREIFKTDPTRAKTSPIPEVSAVEAWGNVCKALDTFGRIMIGVIARK